MARLHPKSSHKGQHFIPSSYLSAWCDPNLPPNQTPFVHVFEKDGSSSKKRAPENIFKQNNIYTIETPDGNRDLKLERWLGRVENSFVLCRRDYLSQFKDVPLESRVRLLVFVAALHARTPTMRDHHGKFWADVRDKGEQMIKSMSKKTPQERRKMAGLFPPSEGRSMSHEDVKRIAEHPMQNLLPAFVSAEAPILARMRLRVLFTRDPVGFITSDNPVTWFSGSAYKLPPMYRSPSFSSPDLEITLPVSPRQCMMLVHGNSDLPCQYLDVPKFVVDEINRRVRFGCQNSFVVQSNVTEPFWFDPGKEPDDSWEKLNP